MYVTEVIPQASDVLPRLGAASNTASVEATVVAEKPGVVMAAVLHPMILRVTAQVVITGEASAATVKVDEHVSTSGAHELV
jgi:hypothetical protein